MAFSFSSALNNLVGNTPGANVSNLVQCLNDMKTYLNGNIDQTNIAASGVGTSQLAANSVTAAKIEVQQAWQTIALAGFSAANLSYMKDSLGFVHFRGDTFTGTSPGAGSTLCTLPAGYRPGSTQYFGVVLTTGATGTATITIDTVGAVKAVGTTISTLPWSFGHVHFRAEN